MGKYFSLFGMCFFSIACSATSCFVSEEDVIDYSKLAQSEVKVDIKKTSSGVDVTIGLPAEIEDLAFSSVTFFKNLAGGGQAELAMPLAVTHENESVSSWYMVGSNLIDENVIEAVYGDPCGVVIRYRVNYENGKIYPELTGTDNEKRGRSR